MTLWGKVWKSTMARLQIKLVIILICVVLVFQNRVPSTVVPA